MRHQDTDGRVGGLDLGGAGSTIGVVSEAAPKVGILFVCTGNICRSPLAEGVFLHLARERGVVERFRVDSCGTGGWHVGERADARMREAAERRGVTLESRARQIDPVSDFPDLTLRGGWDLIVVMDLDNKEMVLSLGAPPERVRLLRSFDPALRGKGEREMEVPDPYYGGRRGFDRVFEMVWAACGGLLDCLAEPEEERAK